MPQTTITTIDSNLADWQSLPDSPPQAIASPEFQAIWECIKTWDISIPDAYRGSMGANSNHVFAILESLSRLKASEPIPVYLTQGECRVLSLLLEGKSNKEIAIELKICVGTVKTHVRNILAASNCKSRTKAISQVLSGNLKIQTGKKYPISSPEDR